MSEERKAAMGHKLILEDRGRAALSGVREVVSFDEECVVCETDLGAVTIKGSLLKVNNLNVETGDLNVEGAVDSVTYSASRGGLRGKQKQSVLGRIFR